MGHYLKSSIEILGIILSLTIAYYELKEVIPNDPIIVLEVELLKTPHDSPAYLLTGVVSDQDYSLESVRLIPYSKNPVKRATFHYDNYTKDIDLIEIKTAMPYTYLVSKAHLQTAFGEDDSFSFDFLDNNRFNFYFQFQGVEPEKIQFECRVHTVENHKVPCEVREKGYLSLMRGIPWYFLAAGFGILLIIIIEVFDLFLKRKPKKTRRRTKKNRLTPDQD